MRGALPLRATVTVLINILINQNISSVQSCISSRTMISYSLPVQKGGFLFLLKARRAVSFGTMVEYSLPAKEWNVNASLSG